MFEKLVVVLEFLLSEACAGVYFATSFTPSVNLFQHRVWFHKKTETERQHHKLSPTMTEFLSHTPEGQVHPRDGMGFLSLCLLALSQYT